MFENTLLKQSLLGYLASMVVDLKKNHKAFAIPPLDPTSSKLFLCCCTLAGQDPLICPTYLSTIRLLSVGQVSVTVIQEVAMDIPIELLQARDRYPCKVDCHHRDRPYLPGTAVP